MSDDRTTTGLPPDSDAVQADEPTPEELRQELIRELHHLVQRLQAITPDYEPPAYSRGRLLSLIAESLGRLSHDSRLDVLQRLKNALGGGLLDVETWQGLWYLINYTLKLQADILKRRFTGEYETDDWGLDWELLETVIPFVNFMYELYWRVDSLGVDNIPLDGPTLLVSNHSGQLPWDGVMIAAAVWNTHPTQRLVRALYSPWLATLPFISAALTKLGQAPATVDNGVRLLEAGELAAIFPEGHRGASKPFTDRYRLAHFGRGEFVKMALTTQAPIVPVAVVGAEETYITLGESPTLARLTGMPRFPITAGFPWLGVLGLIPLPTKWTIEFGPPIPTESYGPDRALDLMLLKELTDQVRDTVQAMIDARLTERHSIFFG